jgi:hypothetical protein
MHWQDAILADPEARDDLVAYLDSQQAAAAQEALHATDILVVARCKGRSTAYDALRREVFFDQKEQAAHAEFQADAGLAS